MKRIALSLVLGTMALACGNGGSSTTTTGSGGSGGKASTSSSSGGTGGSDAGAMCVAPGAPGNALGVGKYCTPGGNECMGLAAGLCTGDIGESSWFCVKVGCQMDADCGAMATCVMQMGGAGCVPNSCLGGSGGAGGAGGAGASDGGA